MAISFRDKNRDPGWFAAFWRAFSSPSFVGVMMILAAGSVFASSLMPDSGFRVLGRVAVLVALGGLVATIIGVASRPRFFGRAATALGIERRLSIPLFREELRVNEPSAAKRRMTVVTRLTLLGLSAGVPLAVAGSAVFDQSLSGQAVVTAGESVESVAVSIAGTRVSRDLGMALKLGQDVDVDAGRAEVLATNSATAETRRPILELGDRLHLNSEYVALSGWRPTLSTRSAVFELLSSEGDVQREVQLQPGAGVDLADGGRLELFETRDAYLELLGPAARVRVTDAGGSTREFWTFTRARDFDVRHGSGSSRVRLLGFEPGIAAVVQLRNSSGQRWDLWAIAFMGAVLLLILGRRLSTGFLTGQSGDYLYVGSGAWFFTTDAEQRSRDEREASLRGEAQLSSDGSSVHKEGE